MNLHDIKDPQCLKNLSVKEMHQLADDIRVFLIDTISKTGGHLSSNLGTVELIIALHHVFNTPDDTLIFDVGHQSYTHKILTGRAHLFETLRQTHGLSGYINYRESMHDQWESGHAGTALSALHGALIANRLQDKKGDVIAVIGDASITNGMAFEALNLVGSDPSLKGIIILNDNEMSISKSVGSISKALTKFRSMKVFMKWKKVWSKILPGFVMRFLSRIKRGLRGFLQRQNIFEDLGYMYIGPIDGHDIKSLIYNLKRIQKVKKSVVLHLITEKGKGHIEAENDKVGTYHGVSKPSNGIKKGISWSEMISTIMMDIQKVDQTFVVMPAMEIGTSFQQFAQAYPDRYLDVGIAEEHAATLSAMLAHRGIHVFLPLYATFAQRAFDQILNDISRSDHHVVFGIDRAGIVGEDGSTHQGLYDVSMFYLMPHVVITMPYDAKEAMNLLYYGFFEQSHPFVIRYPRGTVLFDREKDHVSFDVITPTWVKLKEGETINLISYGPSLDLLMRAADELHLDANIINARFIKPIDDEMLHHIFSKGAPTLVYEECANTGSLYPQILNFMAIHGYHHPITDMSITDVIVDHGHYHDILQEHHMDLESIKKRILSILP